MKLKARLVLAFLTIIFIPILTFIGLISLLTYNMEELNEQQQEETEQLISSIHKVVIEKHHLLNDPIAFFKEIIPIIEQYPMEIVISTPENEILFDSSLINDRNRGFMFTIRQTQVQTINREIFNIEFQSDSVNLMAHQSEQKIIVTLLIAIGAALLVLIALVCGLTIYISRTILNPLKEIYTATEEMTEGNLDYEIFYRKKDEIGRFINGFNLMRSHLKQSLATQRQYEQNRKELIATISHDLRTPLQSIKGYVEGINDGIVQNEKMKKRYLEVILSKTEQLDRLIEDLFEFSKIDLDHLVMEKRLVNSEDYFSNLFWDEEMDIKRKTVEFILTKPIPSVLINIDPIRIQQVITNLLDNAVRYGGTIIKVKISEDLSTKTLKILIKDNGNGIAKEDIPNIFDLFYRGEKSRSRELGGTGLGLSIGKSIIEAHNGTINVESQEGKGSVFIIKIPYWMREE